MTELITSKEAATLLNCAETTVRRYVRKGNLLHYLEISNYGRYRKAIGLLQKEGQVA